MSPLTPARTIAAENRLMLRSLVSAIALLVTLPVVAATQGGVIPVPLPLFPANNWWNTDISNAPVDAQSTSFMTFVGLTRGMHPDFGGDDGAGGVYGIPFILVDGTQPKVTVTFTDYGDESDGWDPVTEASFPFYPVPPEAITQPGWVEGGQPGSVDVEGDRHIIVVDTTNNHLYELFNTWHNGTGWEASSGAFFDMNTNNRRPEGWTSADAAGLAILPGLVRYDEAFGEDEIRHAFRVTVRATNGHVFPASHTAGSTAGALPLGARLRLKASKDISSYAPEIQKIFRAMKRYGLIVADNGSDLYVSGAYDTRWNNDVLNPAFRALKGSDFEVVQLGWQPPRSLVLSLPDIAGNGDATSATLTVYDSNGNVATGYTGTVHFTSTDGAATLPLDYTFTGSDAGVHTFSAGFTMRTAGTQVVTVTDVAQAFVTGSDAIRVGPPTPLNVAASASSTAQVAVSWTASAGAAQYEVQRRSASGSFATIGMTASTTFSDTTVTAAAAFVYRVRAIDAASRPSPFSNLDLASTFAFTDPALTAGLTTVKAVHLTELRSAVDAVRAVAGLGPASFSDSTLTGIAARVVHVHELRDALTSARATLGLPAVTFSDPSLAARASLVRRDHVSELRAATQ